MSYLSAHPVAELTAAEAAGALTRSFEGYLLGPMDINARTYERRFRAEDLDPFASRVYRRGDTVAGVLLVARRGWTSRIAGMGVAPEERKRGLGSLMLRRAVEEARARGDKSVLLEVFAQNKPAVILYEKLGFRTRRRLIGYRRKPGNPVSERPGKLAELDPLEVARIVACECEPGLPWMLSAETLSAVASPSKAYHLDHRAYAVVEAPEAASLVLSTLAVPRSERLKGWGTHLLRALETKFADRALSIPAVVPEGLADAFLSEQGWEPESLSQLEMVLKLPQAKQESS